MNRLFGTRFNVSSARCTDGIWMSIANVKKDKSGKSRLFLILDCEGLMSTSRNEVEDVKLCLALAAVSDTLILNADISFNRNLNFLLDRFTKSVGKIKGKNLFKGDLIMILRDVKNSEAKNAIK